MEEKKNEIVKTFGDQLVDELDYSKSALPKDLNKMRFVQNALAVLNGSTDLSKCNRNSVMTGLMKGAYLGLDFANKECYLIPYGNEAQFQTSYIGEVKFTKKYATQKIKDIYAKVVRKGDDFKAEIIDGQPHIHFSPVPFNGEEIIGVFAVCLFENGTQIYEEMSTADVNAVRNNYSKVSNTKAWKNSWDEMAKKTVIRRLCKHIDTDFESIEARNAWEEGSGMEFTAQSSIDRTEVVNPFAKKEEEITEEPVIDVEATEIPMPEVFQ